MICEICKNKKPKENKRFCSKDCWKKTLLGKPSPSFGKNSKIDKKCVQCEVKFSVFPCNIRITHCSNACKYKTLSKTLRGKNSHLWKGGITPLLQKIRQEVGPQLRMWRKSVFERDDYTCQNCKERGGYLEADHIKPFSNFPELRFEITNGRTLCKQCHYKIGWNLFREDNPKFKIVNN